MYCVTKTDSYNCFNIFIAYLRETGCPMDAPCIRSLNLFTLKLDVFSPITKLTASIKFDLPEKNIHNLLSNNSIVGRKSKQHVNLKIACTKVVQKVLGLTYNQRETRDKWPLDRDPDRSWCYLHTSVKLSWSQPME